MRETKIPVFFLAFAVLGSGDEARAQDRTAALLADPLSFHRQLLDETPSPFKEDFKPGCPEKLRDLVRAGRSFAVPAVRESSEGIARSKRLHPEYGSRFFHWSKSEALRDIADRNDVNAIYAFLRAPSRSPGMFAWYGSPHVADDPGSTLDYGKTLVAFDLFPDARVLNWDLHMGQEDGLVARIREAYRAAFPEASECYEPGPIYNEGFDSPVFFLVFEASGIDLVRYRNFDDGHGAYYFVLNPHSLERLHYVP